MGWHPQIDLLSRYLPLGRVIKSQYPSDPLDHVEQQCSLVV